MDLGILKPENCEAECGVENPEKCELESGVEKPENCSDVLRGGGTGGSDVLRGGGIGDRAVSNGALKLSEELRDGGGAFIPVCRLCNVGIRLKVDAGRPPARLSQ